MTVTIVLHPAIAAANTSVVVGDQGFFAQVSQFSPLESADAVSGTQGSSNGPNRSSLKTSSGKLVITWHIQTFDNEASWSTSVKEQLAVLAYKEKVIVGRSAAAKSGTGDSIAAGTGGYAKLTDAGAAFLTTDVNRSITLSGAPTAANNGIFVVRGFIDANNILYDNPNYVVEAAPVLAWSITGSEPLTPTEIRAL